MQAKQSPFIMKAMVCPVCHAKTEHRFFRRRIFTIEATEPDQHVVRYKWTSSNVQRVNPLYFALYFCPECFYTDVAEEFSKPFETELGTATVKAFKKVRADHTLLELLGRHIDYKDIDFDVALRLHMLAVLIHSLVQRDMQDPYKLARLFLRIAWLYREQEQGLPEGVDEASAVAQNLPGHDPGCAPQLLAAVEAMQQSQSQREAEWQALDTLIRQRAREMTQLPGTPNPYPLSLGPLAAAWKGMREGLEKLRDVAFRDSSAILTDAGKNGAKPETSDADNARHERRAQFLPPATFSERLRTLWEDVPQNELEALTQALEQFRRALSTDIRLENPQSRLKISSLVVELQLRRRDYEGAFEVTRDLHKLATTSRQKLQARLREDDVTEDEARRISGLIQKANSTIESTTELRDGVILRIVKSESQRIREALTALPPKAQIDDFQRALAAIGIPKEVIMHLKKRNMQLPAS